MQALVAYGSSGEESEEETQGRAGDGQRSAIDTAGGERSGGGSSRIATTKVFTSLGTFGNAPRAGDWLCHTFIELAADSQVGQVLQEAQRYLTKHAVGVPIEPQSTLHISLSRPIVLRRHESDALVPIVRQAVGGSSAVNGSANTRISLAFAAFAHLPSHDAGRTYFVAEIGQGWPAVRQLTTSLDRALATLGQRAYHEEARFHCSFASIHSPSEPDDRAGAAAEEIVTRLNKRFAQALRQCEPVVVQQVCVSIGRQVHRVQL